MALLDIHHIALRCKPGNLDATVDFYTRLLGMKSAERPDLGFPGAWLDVNNTMFHFLDYTPPKYLDPWHEREHAEGPFDHIAIKSHDFDAMRQRLIDAGADWRQLNLSHAGLWQLFVRDPNDVIIEMNFTISDEPSGAKGPDGSRPYMLVDTYSDGTASGTINRQDR